MPEPYRPLQLPDVIRRKQQDLLVAVAAPQVYGTLSSEHAAGSTHRDCATCIHNQLAALDYGVRTRRQGPGSHAPVLTTEMLTRLIGPSAMQTIEDIETEEQEHWSILLQENPTDKYPLGRQQRYGQGFDQMKAYEMLCVRFLIKVMEALRIRADQYIGPIIWLARSLGMGGPAAPMFWDLAYDVIVTFIQATPGVIGAPTYADDMQLVCASVRSLAWGCTKACKRISHDTMWIVCVVKPHRTWSRLVQLVTSTCGGTVWSTPEHTTRYSKHRPRAGITTSLR